jgi:hypothetical protein
MYTFGSIQISEELNARELYRRGICSIFAPAWKWSAATDGISKPSPPSSNRRCWGMAQALGFWYRMIRVHDGPHQSGYTLFQAPTCTIYARLRFQLPQFNSYILFVQFVPLAVLHRIVFLTKSPLFHLLLMHALNTIDAVS